MDKKRKMQENHNLEDIGKAIEKGMNNGALVPDPIKKVLITVLEQEASQ